MKFLFLMITMIFSFNASPANKEVSGNYGARAHVVMNAITGEVMQGNNIHLSRSVASISKIMTAIVSLESNRIFDIVEVKSDVNKIVGSSIYLKVGDKITVLDLVYGLMLRSGNDAAEMLALYLGGTVDKFAIMMNNYAKKIGMSESKFNNPSGLDMDSPGNFSSAFDMALLMKYALNNELFRAVTSTTTYKSNYGLWVNKNKLLTRYEYCTGGKTGFTSLAKRTLVTTAKKDNLELIVVTLDCGSDFAFHEFLYESYFKKFTFVNCLYKGYNLVAGYKIFSEDDVGFMVEKSRLSGSFIIYRIYQGSKYVMIYFLDRDNNEELIDKVEVTYE